MKIVKVDIFRIVPLSLNFPQVFHIDAENIPMRDAEQFPHVVKPLRSSAMHCGVPQCIAEFRISSAKISHVSAEFRICYAEFRMCDAET